MLQNWNLKCNDKNNYGKKSNFIQSTKSNSPTGDSAATSLPPIGDSFLYMGNSCNNHGDNVFCSFERTDNIQNTNITFKYNRFSVAGSNKTMSRFRIQIFLEDNIWSTRYYIPENDRYSDTSTDWTLLSLSFCVESYVVELTYDEIDSAHADMCFSNITITLSIY